MFGLVLAVLVWTSLVPAAFSCHLFHLVSQEPYNSAMLQTVFRSGWGVLISHPSLHSSPQQMAESLIWNDLSSSENGLHSIFLGGAH